MCLSNNQQKTALFNLPVIFLIVNKNFIYYKYKNVLSVSETTTVAETGLFTLDDITCFDISREFKCFNNIILCYKICEISHKISVSIMLSIYFY